MMHTILKNALLLLVLLAATGPLHAQRLSWAPVGTKWVFGYDEWKPEDGPTKPEYAAYGILEVKAASTVNGNDFRQCWLEECSTCDVKSTYEVELLHTDSATLYRVLWDGELVPARDCNSTDTLRAFQPLYHHCPPDSSPVIFSVNSIDSLCYRVGNVRDTTIGSFRFCLHDVWPENQTACGLAEIEPCPDVGGARNSTLAHHFKSMNQRSRSIDGIGLLDVVPLMKATGKDAADWGLVSRAQLRCFFHPDLGWINFETGELNSSDCFRFRGTGSRPRPVKQSVRYAYEASTQQLKVLDPELHAAACRVYDVWGRELMRQQLNEGVLELGGLLPGAYCVVLNNHSFNHYFFRFINY